MEWEKNFYRNISTYIKIINTYLSGKYPLEKLGKYIKVQGGYAFKKTEYKKTGVPIIRISDFQNEKIVLSNVMYYNDSEELSRYELNEGDIIIAMTGGTIGKLAIVQSGLGKIYLNQRVGKFVILNKDNFFKEYVYWIARGVEEKVKNLGYGGAQPNVSNKQIEDLEFPFPKVDEQKEIVSFLNDLKNNSLNKDFYFNDLIEKKIIDLHLTSIEINNNIISEQEKQQSYLTKLKEAILQNAVQGKLVEQNSNDEPASVLLEKIKKEKEQLIKEKKIKKEKPLPKITQDEIPYELPNSWMWVRLGDIYYNLGQKIPNQKFTYIDVASIKKEKGCLGNTDNILLPQDAPSRARKIVSKGDIIYSTVRPYLLNIAIIDKEFDFEPIVSTAFVVLKPYCNISNKYIFYFLRSNIFNKYVEAQMIGAVYPAINDKQFRNGLFPLPPLEEQKRIVEKIDTLMVYCDELEQEINKSKKQAEQLMQSVLKEAFEQKGELLVEN